MLQAQGSYQVSDQYKAATVQGLAAQNVQAAPTPVTLARAISMADDLNNRLDSLCSAMCQIASAIGGPFPTSAVKNVDQPVPCSAIGALNEKIDRAHGWITELEGSTSAIRRSLGG